MPHLLSMRGLVGQADSCEGLARRRSVGAGEAGHVDPRTEEPVGERDVKEQASTGADGNQDPEPAGCTQAEPDAPFVVMKSTSPDGRRGTDQGCSELKLRKLGRQSKRCAQ